MLFLIVLIKQRSVVRDPPCAAEKKTKKKNTPVAHIASISQDFYRKLFPKGANPRESMFGIAASEVIIGIALKIQFRLVWNTLVLLFLCLLVYEFL